MKLHSITSAESLDTAVASVVRLKIQRTAAVAKKDALVAGIEKEHQSAITDFDERISEQEAEIFAYCEANREALFRGRKSRETSLAEFGFEITPPRVETASKKIKWKDVVARLMRLAWGKAYVRQPAPQPDKEALLADRAKLTPEQLTAAGIRFCQDEQFFLRPKPQTAQDSVREAAAA